MKKLITLFVLISMTAPFFAQEQPAGLKRFAIFAGSNNGGDKRVQLEYAESDALSMYEVFSEIGGLLQEDTIIITDPGTSDIYSAFDKMKILIDSERDKSRRTEFFFYYSGHSDEMGILPAGDILNYSELREKINQMDTDVRIAVLDSCSSGAFTRLKGGIKKAPFLVDESVDTTGHAFLTSSSENEAAQESDMIEGSYFTHYLISALRGAADNTQDGTVTLNEAYSFAADETLARTTSSIAGAQHPSYSINLTGSGDLVLTDLREVMSSITIDKEIDGRIYFRDDSDRLVIEFRKRAGIPVALSLPGGLYKVDLQTETSLTSSILTVHQGIVHLSSMDFSPVERSFARTRGEEEAATAAAISEGTIEQSLENKMEEIRSLINEKFSEDIDNDLTEETVATEKPVKTEAAERTDLDYMVLGFSLTPSLNDSNDVRNISINFIGKPYAINGFSLGFMNMTHHDVKGAQIAAISNETGRDHIGLMSSGIFNHVNGDLWGVASSGIFNTSNGAVSGVQASGIFNICSGNFYGVQASGIFNYNSGETFGVQASGIFNYSESHTGGVQAAGIFNTAYGQFSGVQASGIFNVAENINGLQVSLVNVGKNVQGMQIGLININDDMTGVPVGLLTFSRNGILEFGGWYENSGFFYTGMQTGSKNIYNIAYIAFPTEGEESILVTGFGLGGRINLGAIYIDIDGSIKNVASGNSYTNAIENTFSKDQPYSLYPNIRIGAGLKIGFMSLFGGLSLDIHIPGATRRSDIFHNSTDPLLISNPNSDFDPMELHPKWFIGFKI
jgi:caspase domain-containing protein